MMQRQMMGQFNNQGGMNPMNPMNPMIPGNTGNTGNPGMPNMNMMNPQGSMHGNQQTNPQLNQINPNNVNQNASAESTSIPSNNLQSGSNPQMNMNMPYYANNTAQSSVNQNMIPAMNSMNSMPGMPSMMQRYPFPMNTQLNRMMFPNQGFNPMMFPQTQTQQVPQENSSVKDLIQNALSIIKSQNSANTSNEEIDDQDLSSIREDTPNVFEKEYSLEEENLKNIWGGFLTKNKKDRVCVDAYQIRNECTEFLNNEYNLNVSHRTQFEDIVKRPIIGIIAFSPQNATQCEIFQDYINYFNEKNRVGLINLKNQMILYLVPPSDFSRKFYQNPKKHLLGIFVNSTVEPKSYVDMNNLSLPPPVISLTEKRLLLKQLKKTNTSAPTVNVSSQNVINSSPNDKLNELSKILGTMEQDKIG